MLIFVVVTFKWSLDEDPFWKETFDEWNCFIFLNKHRQLYCPENVKNIFLPSNRNKAIDVLCVKDREVSNYVYCVT